MKTNLVNLRRSEPKTVRLIIRRSATDKSKLSSFQLFQAKRLEKVGIEEKIMERRREKRSVRSVIVS